MNASPFSYRRRVAWGECDPARISYAPRAIDYAIEAIEAWREAVLEVSWSELVDQYKLGVPFVRVECDYLRPLVASQVIQLRVWVARPERSSVKFIVVGEGGDGEPYFQVRLDECFVEKKTFFPAPIPLEFRQRIETYRAQCGEAAATVNRGLHTTSSEWNWIGSGAELLGRHVLTSGADHFCRQLRVMSGDCDASGIIYPPRVFDYAVEIIGEWYEEIPGVSWMELICNRKQGAPFVSANCEFLRPMIPGLLITVVVWVTSLGGSSIRFAVVGYDDSGQVYFDARLAACFIDLNGFKTMQIPEEYRLRIQTYRSACGSQ